MNRRAAVRETSVSLGKIRDQLRTPHDTPRTSQHYRIEGLKGRPQLVPYYAETRLSLRQRI